MNVSIDIDCDCYTTQNKKTIFIVKPKKKEPSEIWVKCNCGNEQYLCDEGDIIG